MRFDVVARSNPSGLSEVWYRPWLLPLAHIWLLKSTYPGVAQLVARLLWEQDAASSSLATWTRKRQVSPETCRFQLSAPIGAWSLLRKWSCPADSEVSAEVGGALNFTLWQHKTSLCPRHNFTSALADTSLKMWEYEFIRKPAENIFFEANRPKSRICLIQSLGFSVCMKRDSKD